MSGVRISLTGKEPTLRELGGYLARVSDTRGLFENIGMSLVTSTQERFQRGVAPDGSPWPPSFRAKRRGGKTLILTGRLMRSVTYQASQSSVEVGTNAIYAAIHQFGGDIDQAARKATLTFKRHKKTGKMLKGFRKAGKGNETREVSIRARTIRMPARPFIGLDDGDTREIPLIAAEWVLGEASGATP